MLRGTKNGQILAISEFSRHIHYDFLKEDHKGSFHTKNYENLYRRLEDIGQKHSKWLFWQKMAKFWPFLAILGVKNFFEVIKVIWRHNFMQKNKNKISNGQGCRTGTHGRTYERTYESEFIGSFRSLKTSGEPKMKSAPLNYSECKFSAKSDNF